MVVIYILKLEEEKYYIGKTKDNVPRLDNFNNINLCGKRIITHFQGKGSGWTRRYKPISVYAIYHDCVDEDEDKYTKIMMKKFGINNVRGGNYCSIKLDETLVYILEREIRGNCNKCLRCGKDGHFIRNCRELIDSNGIYIDDNLQLNELMKEIYDTSKNLLIYSQNFIYNLFADIH